MAIRFISNSWSITDVIPVEKKGLVEDKVSHLIDVSWLKDTTVIEELIAFAKEASVSFHLEADNDFGEWSENFKS